jgi:hypothetical protein
MLTRSTQLCVAIAFRYRRESVLVLSHPRTARGIVTLHGWPTCSRVRSVGLFETQPFTFCLVNMAQHNFENVVSIQEVQLHKVGKAAIYLLPRLTGKAGFKHIFPPAG